VSDTHYRQEHATRTKDLLLRLGEGIGTLPVENPEGGAWGENARLSTADVVSDVEKVLGFELGVQHPQQGFNGLAYGDVMLTERMIHGAYVAHRSAQLVGDPSRAHVIEIGAGVGYAACYARRFGIRSYTIIDLPLTNVEQAYFLGRVLGEDEVVLFGEEDPGRPGVRIMTPAITRSRPHADLVVNVDSLTELGIDAAIEYIDLISAMECTHLSINHEANAFTVHSLWRGRAVTIERFPYWLRNGYVEEVIRPLRP
jgi:hypothetical protein